MSWTHWHGVKMRTKQKASICITAKQDLTIVEMYFFFLGTERIFRGSLSYCSRACILHSVFTMYV